MILENGYCPPVDNRDQPSLGDESLSQMGQTSLSWGQFMPIVGGTDYYFFHCNFLKLLDFLK